MLKIVKINAMWCSACISMYKIWSEVTKRYPNINIIELDFDMDEDEVKKYDVKDILPVVIFYKDDKELARLEGEKKLDDIINIIEENK